MIVEPADGEGSVFPPKEFDIEIPEGIIATNVNKIISIRVGSLPIIHQRLF
jgi:hypothetical protein